jgi:hypothetical protein
MNFKAVWSKRQEGLELGCCFLDLPRIVSRHCRLKLPIQLPLLAILRWHERRANQKSAKSRQP